MCSSSSISLPVRVRNFINTHGRQELVELLLLHSEKVITVPTLLCSMIRFTTNLTKYLCLKFVWVSILWGSLSRKVWILSNVLSVKFWKFWFPVLWEASFFPTVWKFWSELKMFVFPWCWPKRMKPRPWELNFEDWTSS